MIGFAMLGFILIILAIAGGFYLFYKHYEKYVEMQQTIEQLTKREDKNV